MPECQEPNTPLSGLTGSVIGCHRPFLIMRIRSCLMSGTWLKSPRPAMFDCPRRMKEWMSGMVSACYFSSGSSSGLTSLLYQASASSLELNSLPFATNCRYSLAYCAARLSELS